MILDASALLALLQDEPGADKVQAVLHRAIINTVNWSEVIQKLSVHDPDAADIRAEMELTGLKIMPLSIDQAAISASLWKQAKPFGLSLADRSCIATGIDHKMEIMTTDKIWQEMALPIAIHVIR
ncbi:type II toxin-antitoxin system VapC family toxin [Thiothrix subterranea]|uniref:Type II toxin-antitoxin system VapC family toxin n=1 Tax=Thiothrix subterranea TaxID=2735563 RepID=A0AA51MTR7_9GAMM|nr:type II toxin-antitoxin system VapC family toxin [Thiothrix subterranea]MDQ5769992.1 type II toxin-antitoxin system VapC family toxin [Thiothrix subterranea]WML88307.1 type II toxin-antitoxin system VapC family toxin [Thiothrix subterranea]